MMASRLRRFEDKVRGHREWWTEEFLPENILRVYWKIMPATRVEDLHTVYPMDFQNGYGPPAAVFPILLFCQWVMVAILRMLPLQVLWWECRKCIILVHVPLDHRDQRLNLTDETASPSETLEFELNDRTVCDFKWLPIRRGCFIKPMRERMKWIFVKQMGKL